MIEKVYFLDIKTKMNSINAMTMFQIPKAKCNKALLKQHFKEAFPRVKIEKLTFAFDVKKLCSINEDIIVITTVHIKINFKDLIHLISFHSLLKAP